MPVWLIVVKLKDLRHFPPKNFLAKRAVFADAGR
jgi:hypothetical protein